MNRQPRRGEIWQADLGMAAKVRPVLIISTPLVAGDYARLATLKPDQMATINEALKRWLVLD
jgi:mRNA-degrading endonuclease toxin of MazEF toxin-antitoxin module